MTDNYFIFTETGDKFCRRYVDENGEVQLQTKNGTITFAKFQMMVMNPSEALKQRGKRPRKN